MTCSETLTLIMSVEFELFKLWHQYRQQSAYLNERTILVQSFMSLQFSAFDDQINRNTVMSAIRNFLCVIFSHVIGRS